jgi:hypothetical protein
MPAIGRVWRSDAAIAPFTQDHCSVAGNAAEDKIAPWNSEGAKMEEPVEERKEHLRDAAAADVVELKDAVEEFTAAAENGTQEAVKIGRWVFLLAAFVLGVLSGRRRGQYLSR